METPTPGQKSNRNLIIGIVAAVVVCCCCTAAALGGYYAWKAYQATQNALEEIQDFELPTDIPTGLPSVPGLEDAELPQGGLADDVSRATAWGTIVLTGSIFECLSPAVTGTSIEVVQEPDANGVWIENWNVACGEGATKSFKITFTPEGGFTNVNVTPAE